MIPELSLLDIVDISIKKYKECGKHKFSLNRVDEVLDRSKRIIDYYGYESIETDIPNVIMYKGYFILWGNDTPFYFIQDDDITSENNYMVLLYKSYRIEMYRVLSEVRVMSLYEYIEMEVEKVKDTLPF